MRSPALFLGFIIACVAAITGCGDNAGRPVGTAKELTAFSFTRDKNASLTADVTATITGDAISATLPTGSDITHLIATFESTGDSVAVNGSNQTSGTTANNFTSPVKYDVTAEDGTVRTYTVTVTSAASSAHELTGYSFLATNNARLTTDITAVINGTAIAATVPFGTDVTALVAAFSTTGTAVTVSATPQVSGTTPNDFTSPVAYKITAADGSTATYTVTVTVAPSTAKALTAFSFLSAKNAGLPADITAVINGTTIAATVPFGTDVSALVATFATTGASVTVGATAQVSGTTPNNFTAPVAYTVTAADGSTATYTVTVTLAASTAKAITTFSFLSVNNGGLPADVAAVINGTAIAATVPSGTNVTALVATFVSTGASVTVGATPQVSGTTPNDFTAPVSYKVTAADGSTATYTVTVTVARNTAKALTAFSFPSATNGGLAADVIATITGNTITAVLPFGTTTAAQASLIATFTSTGTSVAVGATAQVSGMTANDFTNPVTYTVTAEDGTTADYTVTVTVALNPAKDLTAFSFLATKNPGLLIAAAPGVLNGTTYTVAVPPGINVTALIATFASTGANVAVAGATQVTDTTPNDFTNPVTYTVTAADGTTKDYTIQVVSLVTSFSFTTAAGQPSAGDEVTFASDGTNPRLTGVPTMARAPGLTPNKAGGAFSSTGWGTAAFSALHYYTFTVTPAAGETLALTSLTLRDQKSGSGPSTYVVRSSVDGFAADLGSFATHPAIATSLTTLALSGFGAVTAAVEFRIYAFGTTNNAGTWRIDDVQLAGSITP